MVAHTAHTAHTRTHAQAADDDKIRKITVQVTGAGPCPWRQPGIKYRKNELFIDVIESVNLLISAKGKFPCAPPPPLRRTPNVSSSVLTFLRLTIVARAVGGGKRCVCVACVGNVLNANVAGQVVMKSFLSGMPECKFGLNDKLLMAKEQRGKKAYASPSARSSYSLPVCVVCVCVCVSYRRRP
jgi:AP-2 complex subunit mu-1